MPSLKLTNLNDIANTWSKYGHSKLRSGHFQEALIYFNQALNIMPEHLAALVGRGVTLQQLKHYHDAMVDFDAALKLNPGCICALAARGETHQLMGLYTDAIEDFNTALKLNPNYVYALVGRGTVARQLGLYKDALSDLDNALKLDSSSTHALAGRGETKRLMGKYKEALADFAAALKINPQQAHALAGCGKIKLQHGHYHEALADFEAALKILPAYSYALAGQGEIMLLLGLYQEALTSFETALKLDPHNSELSAWLEYTKSLLQHNTLANSHKAVQDAGTEYDDIDSWLELEPLEGHQPGYPSLVEKRKTLVLERTLDSFESKQEYPTPQAYKKQVLFFQVSVSTPSSAKPAKAKNVPSGGFFKLATTVLTPSSTKANQPHL